MEITRSIRKSGFNDYFAIDEVDKDQNIVTTILYLREGEQAPVMIKSDFKVTNFDGCFQQWEMQKGYIRFDGKKVEMTYDTESVSPMSSQYWWEPTEGELLSRMITHFK